MTNKNAFENAIDQSGSATSVVILVELPGLSWQFAIMDLVSGSDNALAELIRNLQDSISRLKEYEQDDGFDVQEGKNCPVLFVLKSIIFMQIVCKSQRLCKISSPKSIANLPNVIAT